jgi:hypothetical protein
MELAGIDVQMAGKRGREPTLKEVGGPLTRDSYFFSDFKTAVR